MPLGTSRLLYWPLIGISSSTSLDFANWLEAASLPAWPFCLAIYLLRSVCTPIRPVRRPVPFESKRRLQQSQAQGGEVQVLATRLHLRHHKGANRSSLVFAAYHRLDCVSFGDNKHFYLCGFVGFVNVSECDSYAIVGTRLAAASSRKAVRIFRVTMVHRTSTYKYKPSAHTTWVAFII